MADDQIKLALQILGAEGPAKLGANLAALNVEAKKAVDGLGAVEKAAEATGAKAKGFGSTIQAAGYAFQDFTATSGDLGAKLNSISNNLPTLLSGFGILGSVAAGAATGLIVLYRNWDTITRAFESKNPFPNTSADIAAMKRELDKAKDSMSKLEENTSLTRGELEKYNGLRTRTAELEKKVADEMERQANIEKLRKLNTPGADELQKDRAETIQGAVGGKQGRIEGALAESMGQADRNKLFQDRSTLEGQIGQTAPGVNRNALQRQLRAIEERIRRSLQGEDFGKHKAAAEGILAGAASGKQGDIDTALGLMGEHDEFQVGAPMENVRNQFQQATPAGQKAARDEAHFVQQQRDQATLARDIKRKADDAQKKATTEADHAREVADKAADEQAKLDLANPERTLAMHGPERLANARARVGGGGGHAGGGGSGGGGGGKIKPRQLGGGGGAAAAGPEADDDGDDEAPGYGASPYGGLKGAKLDRAKRAARLKAIQEAKEDRARKIRFERANKGGQAAHPSAAMPDEARIQQPDVAAQLAPALHSQAQAGKQGLGVQARTLGLTSNLVANYEQLAAGYRHLDQALGTLERRMQPGRRTGAQIGGR